jgi:hypothetical protein
MNIVSINPELISWAKRRAGVETADLLQLFPKFAEWEKGASAPTLNQLEKLARRLCAPLGYFFLKKTTRRKTAYPRFSQRSR